MSKSAVWLRVATIAAVALAVTLAASTLAAGALVGRHRQEPGHSPLACGPGEMTVVRSFFGGDVPGGPQGPEEALDAYLTSFPKLKDHPRAVAGESATSSLFDFTDGGAPRGRMLVADAGDSWAVTSIAGCAKWVMTNLGENR